MGSIAGLTLVVPLFVLGLTGGNWRAALQAWRQYLTVLAVMAAPAALIALAMFMWPPRP